MGAMASQAAAAGIAFLWLLCTAQAATTRLQFFMHDNFNLRPKTVVQVAGKGSGTFGSVMVIDDPLTEGPSPASKVIGRGQGTYMMSALDGSSLLLTFTAVLSSGDTISFHGADRFLLAQREIAVIGGTGKFRMARGYAVLNTTVNSNRATIIGMDVVVVL